MGTAPQTTIIEVDQTTDSRDEVAETLVRWKITPGDEGTITVEYKSDKHGWCDYGTITAEDVVLKESSFSDDSWDVVEWTAETGGRYRLTVTGPHKQLGMAYQIAIEKRTVDDPDEEQYLSIQDITSKTLPKITVEQ